MRTWLNAVAAMACAFALSISAADAKPRRSFHSDAPDGCPRTLFCGCALSLKIFGRIVTSPNLKQARTWFMFPRTRPAPGMVAVRTHHVFQLLSHVEGDVWNVYDPNSGGHQTRIHERSIRGHAIVDPHGRQLAGL